MRSCWLALMLGVGLAGAWSAGAEEENLLQNAGFEAGNFEGWTSFGQGWRVSDFVSESSRDMYEGKFGLLNEIVPTDKDEWRGAQQVVRVKSRKAYEAGAWVRVVQVGDSQSYLEIQFLDKQSNILDQVQSVSLLSDQDFNWVGIDYFESPQDACWASVRVIVRMLNAPERDIGYHMFDEFSFMETKKLSKSARKNQ